MSMHAHFHNLLTSLGKKIETKEGVYVKSISEMSFIAKIVHVYTEGGKSIAF